MSALHFDPDLVQPNTRPLPSMPHWGSADVLTKRPVSAQSKLKVTPKPTFPKTAESSYGERHVASSAEEHQSLSTF